MYQRIFNHFYMAPTASEFGENKANYTAITLFKVIQGHGDLEWSPILVPIESQCATAY